MKLLPTEIDLICSWTFAGGQVMGGAVCKRIEWLIAQHLKHVDVADGGWSNLYQDPDDLRLWEHTYPHGEMHGGGPPRLTLISPEAASARYSFMAGPAP